MRRFNKWQITIRILLAVSFLGTTFGVGCLGTMVKSINPCGTIIDCDPLEFDLLFMDIPNFEADPSCTIPGYCDGPVPFPTDVNLTNGQGAGGGAAAGAGGTGTIGAGG